MSDLEMKSFGPFEIKSEDRGEVEAIVATLGVVDKDGDVILPGAVPPGGARVKLSGYDHDVITKGAPPAGKGVITEEDGRLVFRGKFFTSTDHGRNAFNTVKELGQEGEWSFGFPRAVTTASLTDEWKAKGAKRMIAGMNPIEASPVFVGAGWGTGTISAKAAEAEGAQGALAAAIESGVALSHSLVVDDSTNAGATVIFDSPLAYCEGTGTSASGTDASEAPAAPVETEEQKAAKEAEAALKAKVEDAMEEFHRVQRALKRMGYAA